MSKKKKSSHPPFYVSVLKQSYKLPIHDRNEQLGKKKIKTFESKLVLPDIHRNSKGREVIQLQSWHSNEGPHFYYCILDKRFQLHLSELC